MKTKEQLDELVNKVNYAKNNLLFNIGRTDGYTGNNKNERYKENQTYLLGFEEGEEWRYKEYVKYNNLTL